MNYRVTGIAFFVIIASLVALLVVGTDGSGHTVFANRSGHAASTNRGINVQTDTNQDQGCEPAGGTSGITNACTATSGPGSTPTSVTLAFRFCPGLNGNVPFSCISPFGTVGCNNIGCTSIRCTGPINGECTTDNGVQLTSCILTEYPPAFISCRLAVPGTGITQSGGVSGEGG
jgi:hypothetical protein